MIYHKVTHSDQTDDAVQYVFIDNFCGNEDELSEGSLEVFSNGDSQSGEFKINSFAFVSDASTSGASVYMHCEVSVCDSDDCAPVCPAAGGARRRRSIASNNDKGAALVQIGPINIRRP